MFTLFKTKLATSIIIALVTTAFVGTATVVASINHVGPLASHSVLINDTHSSRDSHGAKGSDDQTAHSFVFLSDGQTAMATISFDSKTNIEQEHGAFAAGTRARVEVITRADKTLYATEIHTLGAGNDPDEEQEDQKLLGTIQSVDLSGHTFMLLPDGQSAAVAITFDNNTNIEQQHTDNHGTSLLVKGVHVLAEVITRADKSLYATEIKVGATSTSGGDDGHKGGGPNPSPTTTPDDHGNGGGGHDDPPGHH
jgi:hypothetical protein